MNFGYIRISTKKQNPDLQINALLKSGIDEENLFTDISSGAKSKRPGLDKLLDSVRRDDTIFVWKLDRIARSLPHFVKLVILLNEKKVSFVSITEPFINTSNDNPHSKFITNIFSCVAELERDLIRERVKEGLDSARRRNVQLGRPKGVKPETMKNYIRAKKLYDANEFSVNEICRMCSISKAKFYSILNDQKKEEENQKHTTKKK